ncbi:hypothetical protein [Leisingera methylohalidivorans]|uniref:Uncharacterized protein n=1 Tax=Leisingera methylohalidivorans DSM 14336 TaxID=999552 RepID=V9VZB2_9RHOB|nr:hypothetical protein [Leisingera methylohalidivorans]AHD03124.1 hypothetical protein METH_12695 [Leisingera methylohalidivorans DSM 14336]
MDAIDLSLAAHFTVTTLPLVTCFAFALRDTIRRTPSQALFPPFANRWTGYGGLWIVILLVAYCCAWIALTFGGCTGGFKNCCTCTLIPDSVGRYASFLILFGFIYLITTALPALVLFGGVEIAYRLRTRKISTH